MVRKYGTCSPPRYQATFKSDGWAPANAAEPRAPPCPKARSARNPTLSDPGVDAHMWREERQVEVGQEECAYADNHTRAVQRCRSCGHRMRTRASCSTGDLNEGGRVCARAVVSSGETPIAFM